MKRALKQGGDNALNVYSTSGGAYLGWAYLPEITDTAQAYLDGIVFSWETVPGASTTYAGQYDLGETLTHEAGHWLNLEHTFFGGCNKTGDFVDDTPAQKSPTSGCPAGKDTCKAPGLDPIHNYMDYSYDSCYTEFTAGQVAADARRLAPVPGVVGARRRVPATRSSDAQPSAARTRPWPARRRLTLRASSPIIRRLRRGPSRHRPLHLNN